MGTIAASRSGTWVTPITFVMIALVILAWTPWAIDHFSDKPLTEKSFGPFKTTVDQATNKILSAELYVRINGNEIARYANYYRIVAVAYHDFGNQDVENITDLQKSAEYFIHPQVQQMLITADPTFLGEMNKGVRSTNYMLVLIPENVRANDITTLHHAKELGAKLFGVGTGPP